MYARSPGDIESLRGSLYGVPGGMRQQTFPNLLHLQLSIFLLCQKPHCLHQLFHDRKRDDVQFHPLYAVLVARRSNYYAISSSLRNLNDMCGNFTENSSKKRHLTELKASIWVDDTELVLQSPIQIHTQHTYTATSS